MKLSDLRKDFGDWDIYISAPFIHKIGPSPVSSFRDDVCDIDIIKVEWEHNTPICHIPLFDYESILPIIGYATRVRIKEGDETLFNGYSNNVPRHIVKDRFIDHINAVDDTLLVYLKQKE